MWLPLLLIALACAAAGPVTFGSDDRWIHHPHGLAVILYSRRLLWPLVTLAVMACMALLGLVIANRRSAWWLFGLIPVLALLGKHFVQRPTTFILENPTFVSTDDARTGLHDADWVVGLVLNDRALALPYKMLATTPIVFITERDKRALLMFCGVGNRAITIGIAREFKARNLEIIATPGGTPLLYDSRLGQFIVAETGETIDQKRPLGFGGSIETEKMTWADWRQLHAETKVLLSYASPATPTAPPTDVQRVAVIASTQPIVIEPASMKTTANQNHSEPGSIFNFKAGNDRLLLVIDQIGKQRVFARMVNTDLFPKFKLQTNRKLPLAFMTDEDTASAWTMDGHAISGPLKGQKLKELSIEEDLDWSTLKFWQPQLTISRLDAR